MKSRDAIMTREGDWVYLSNGQVAKIVNVFLTDNETEVITLKGENLIVQRMSIHCFVPPHLMSKEML